MGKGRFLLVCLWLAGAGLLHATHNRAGEIIIRQTGDLTVEVTVVTYTKTSSTQADRDSVEVMWGDGTSQWVQRANGEGTPLANNRKLNYYIATHTYPGRATYTISMMDPNRNGGILNVNPPNSEGVPFYIEATYTFLNPQFQGYNNTAVLLQPPIDFACVGQRYIHNPNAYDPDGDSLAYEFIVPMQDSGLAVPNFTFPSLIGAGPDNVMTLDPVTGDIVWDAPRIAGEYNIAFRINEYRNGVLISTFIRDMQILVLACSNLPPEITSIDEVCVVAGQPVDLPITVTDPDPGQLVELTASGAPFLLTANPAQLLAPAGFSVPPLVGRIRWTPACNDIREQPYTIIVKAVDNYLDTTGLVDLHAIRITVIGPPPEDPAVRSVDDGLEISWDLPYSCEVTDGGYFKGFSVWRRKGSNQFVADTCETGLDGRGYTRIIANWKGESGGRYAYVDDPPESEGNYCYRILAEFARTTPSGQPYLRVVSIPSAEVCIRTRADLPLLTRASVTNTDGTNGSVDIRWIGPDPGALDTVSFPAPYRYVLLRADGIDGSNYAPVPGAEFTSPNFSGLANGAFSSGGLDTRSQGHRYRLDLYSAASMAEPYGSAPSASTVFLQVTPSDQSNALSWDEDTPWDNFAFEIWRSTAGGAFEMIGMSTDNQFTDKDGLVNGIEYCYRITALGDYGLQGLESPLVNDSQVACGIPQDNVGPCTPLLAVTNGCSQGEPTPGDILTNLISWQPGCGPQDIAYYILYYTPEPGGEWVEIARPDFGETTFEHQPDGTIAGCYAIVAVDALGNASSFAEAKCVQNCPLYELPNAFTPNGDGRNDLYRPIRARYIDRVDFKVFNRWGQLVFQTSDPMINWDGTNRRGKDLSDGVYYYTCDVFESSGTFPSTLTGFIELIRG